MSSIKDFTMSKRQNRENEIKGRGERERTNLFFKVTDRILVGVRQEVKNAMFNVIFL